MSKTCLTINFLFVELINIRFVFMLNFRENISLCVLLINYENDINIYTFSPIS